MFLPNYRSLGSFRWCLVWGRKEGLWAARGTWSPELQAIGELTFPSPGGTLCPDPAKALLSLLCSGGQDCAQ